MEPTTIIFIWLIVLSVFLLFCLVGTIITYHFAAGLHECMQSLVYAYEVQTVAMQKVVQVLKLEGNLLRGLRDLDGLKQRLQDAKGQIKKPGGNGGLHGH